MEKIEKIEASKEGKLPVTKLDAAIRQLETAIKLWFYDADPVSIATLTYAGYQIISDLCVLRHGKPLAMNHCDGIREEYRAVMRKILRDTPNFFKHADKDPHETHYFHPDLTILHALEACDEYSKWGLEKRPIFELFTTWMILTKPEVMKPEIQRRVADSDIDFDFFIQKGKRGYFDAVLVHFSKIC